MTCSSSAASWFYTALHKIVRCFYASTFASPVDVYQSLALLVLLVSLLAVLLVYVHYVAHRPCLTLSQTITVVNGLLHDILNS